MAQDNSYTCGLCGTAISRLSTTEWVDVENNKASAKPVWHEHAPVGPWTPGTCMLVPTGGYFTVKVGDRFRRDDGEGDGLQVYRVTNVWANGTVYAVNEATGKERIFPGLGHFLADQTGAPAQ